MKVRWAPDAEHDLERILDHIQAENPFAFGKMAAQFRDGIALLSRHPLIAPVGKLRGTRELSVHKNYRIVYRAQAGTLRILRVLHVARRWPPV